MNRNQYCSRFIYFFKVSNNNLITFINEIFIEEIINNNIFITLYLYMNFHSVLNMRK